MFGGTDGGTGRVATGAYEPADLELRERVVLTVAGRSSRAAFFASNP
jgi:hypothetical protein